MKMPAVVEREQLPVAEARAGDQEAWDTLFRRYQLPLYTYVFEMIRDEQNSLDIVQDAFIRAVRYIGTLRDDSKFGSWLFGIAHQRLALFWRKAAREQQHLHDLTDSVEVVEDAADEIIISREEESRVLQAVELLPADQRMVLLLRYVEDFSLEEIATVTSVPAGTVKSRLHYAKRALRELLERQQ